MLTNEVLETVRRYVYWLRLMFVANGEHVTAGDCRCCRCHQNRLIIEFARRLANGSIPYLQICNACCEFRPITSNTSSPVPIVIPISHWLSVPSTDPAVRYRWDGCWVSSMWSDNSNKAVTQIESTVWSVLQAVSTSAITYVLWAFSWRSVRGTVITNLTLGSKLPSRTEMSARFTLGLRIAFKTWSFLSDTFYASEAELCRGVLYVEQLYRAVIVIIIICEPFYKLIRRWIRLPSRELPMNEQRNEPGEVLSRFSSAKCVERVCKRGEETHWGCPPLCH